uniref:adhesion G-protein coupled receptor D2 n=1 Tax=Myxine glutinosa TaxID=7769 RepID=UPI00358FB954
MLRQNFSYLKMAFALWCLIAHLMFSQMAMCFSNDFNLDAPSAITFQRHFELDGWVFEVWNVSVSWPVTQRLCRQKFGRAVVILSAQENSAVAQNLWTLGAHGPVWLKVVLRGGGKGAIMPRPVPHHQGFETTPQLNFPSRTDFKYAQLRVQMPPVEAVTMCVRLQCVERQAGILTIFSYAAPEFTNAFQLRGNILAPGEPVQVAVIVHGKHGPYRPMALNDGRWHHVCVTWDGHDGTWIIYMDAKPRGRGRGLHAGSHIAGGGIFILAQEQDSLGGSFKLNEAFTGNLTDFHLWQRCLSEPDILAAMHQCVVPKEELLFSWDRKLLDVESSVEISDHIRPCKAETNLQRTESRIQAPIPRSQNYHNLSTTSFQNLTSTSCITLHPRSGKWQLSDCQEEHFPFCKYRRNGFNTFQQLSSNLTTDFVSKLTALAGNTTVSDFMGMDSHLLFENLSTVVELAEKAHRVLLHGGVVLQATDVLVVTRLLQDVSGLMGEHRAGTLDMSPERVCGAFLGIAGQLLDARNSPQWDGVQQVIGGPMIVAQNLDEFASRLLNYLPSNQLNITINAENIDFHLQYLDLVEMANQSILYYPDESLQTDTSDHILILPEDTNKLLMAGHQYVGLISARYSSLARLTSSQAGDSRGTQTERRRSLCVREGNSGSKVCHREEDRVLSSAVISATIRLLGDENAASKSLSTPIFYTVKHRSQEEILSPRKSVCVFWNFSLNEDAGGDWSDDGCKPVHTDINFTSCYCNHTTNFAVLLQLVDVKRGKAEEEILNVLTLVGCGTSLCALLLTMALFVILDIPKSDRISIHKNLFLSLIAAQVVLLCSNSATSSQVACTVVTALMHLLFMASFTWMLVEGLLLWSKVVTVNLSEESHMKYYYIVGWGIPVLIVGITLLAAFDSYTSASTHCWLDVQSGVIWAFVGPVLFIITVNLCILTRVLLITLATAKRRSIMLALNSSTSGQTYDQIRSAVKAMVVLLPILGLTWLCGVTVHLNPALAYIFVTLNSLQGLFIFLVYGVYNTEVRTTFKRMKERRKALSFSNCAASSRPSSSLTSSRVPSGTESQVTGLTGLTLNERGQEENVYTELTCELPSPLNHQPQMEIDSMSTESSIAQGQLRSNHVPEPQVHQLPVACNCTASQQTPKIYSPGGLDPGCNLHVPTALDSPSPRCAPLSHGHSVSAVS